VGQFWVQINTRRRLCEGPEKNFRPTSVQKKFLHELDSEGGKSELFVGFFSEESIGFILQAKDLRSLADLCLDLAVEIYV